MAILADEEILPATPHKVIGVTDVTDQAVGIAWWEVLTACSGEGMVVKPLSFVGKGQRGPVQPVVKCRGVNTSALFMARGIPRRNVSNDCARGLSAKRSLALRAFALGLEALERCVRQEPFYRVHECVFGILALESELVNPRL